MQHNMTRATYTLGLVLVAVSLLSLVSADLFFHRHHPPSPWVREEAASNTTLHYITIVLPPNNTLDVQETLNALSDPYSERYGRWLEHDEVSAMLAPSAAVQAAILNFLNASHTPLENVTVENNHIIVTATIAHINAVFNTTLYRYRHNVTGANQTSAHGQVHLPAHIGAQIAFISNLTTFPMPITRLSIQTDFPSIDDNGMPRYSQAAVPLNKHDMSLQQSTYAIAPPQQLASMYNWGPVQTNFWNQPHYNPRTSIAVLSFENDYFSNSDTTQFLHLMSFTAFSNLTINSTNTYGPNDASYPQLESNLDVQTVTSLAPTSQIQFRLATSEAWIYYTLYNLYHSNLPLPQVMTISWGSEETSNQCELGYIECATSSYGVSSSTYLSLTDSLVAAFGLLGVTIVVASGDNGANAWQSSCSSSSLESSFPASSPYVLSVGATDLFSYTTTSDSTVANVCGASSSYISSYGLSYSYYPSFSGLVCINGGTEQAPTISQSGFTSGGGFSQSYSQPSYQTAAVSYYLNDVTHISSFPTSGFSSSNRAIPDVSAFGGAWLNVVGSAIQTVAGTSLSAQVWGAVISSLNVVSLQYTNKTLGFINPLLYAMQRTQPSTFNDIVAGDNVCPQPSLASCTSCTGFDATVGWDAVTGLGTPNIAVMKNWLASYYQYGMPIVSSSSGGAVMSSTSSSAPKIAGCGSSGIDLTPLTFMDLLSVDSSNLGYVDRPWLVAVSYSGCNAGESGCQTPSGYPTGQQQIVSIETAASDATSLTWTTINVPGFGIGLQYITNSGDSTYCSGGAPRSVIAQFVCGPTVNPGTFIVTGSGCTYTILIQTSLACPLIPSIAGCGYNGVDLSATTQADIYLEDYEGYGYVYRPCLVSTSYCSSGVSCCQTDGWPGSQGQLLVVQYAETNALGVTWGSEVVSGVGTGYYFSTTSGDSYYCGVPRMLTEVFVCGSTLIPSVVNITFGPQTCSYIFTMGTTLMC